MHVVAKVFVFATHLFYASTDKTTKNKIEFDIIIIYYDMNYKKDVNTVYCIDIINNMFLL